MIYFEIELRDTLRAVTWITDTFSSEIRRGEIQFTATNAFQTESEEIAVSIEEYFCETADVEIGFEATKDCEDCDGEGNAEYGPICSRPASSCCGGCFETIDCNECTNGRVEWEG